MRVGDLVKLKNGEWVPADCVLLSTGDQHGRCYFSTETLDGERNLKEKYAVGPTQGQLTSGAVKTLQFSYNEPEEGLYTFGGAVTGGAQAFALEYKHFVPRGSVTLHSEDVYALVVYTGQDTKQVLNQGHYKLKISGLQREVNKYMTYSLCLIIFLVVLMSQVMNRSWHSNNLDESSGGENHYYLWPVEQEKDLNATAINALFSFFLLFNSFIPLNMAVINFLTWFFYTAVVRADPLMIGEARSVQKNEVQKCKVKNMDLIQDLVLTNNLFCDKTGTLTKNLLVFHSLIADNKTFSFNKDEKAF